MKLTYKRLRYLVKDEKKAAKEYRRYGLNSLARDEARHRRILLRRLKKVIKRRKG